LSASFLIERGTLPVIWGLGFSFRLSKTLFDFELCNIVQKIFVSHAEVGELVLPAGMPSRIELFKKIVGGGAGIGEVGGV